MSQLDQLLLNFKFKKNYDKNDFFVYSSNFYAFTLIDTWPNWEKNIINICGERYCGKTHLAEIFLKKNKGKLINLKKDNIDNLNELRLFENIVIDNFDRDIDKNYIFALFNFVDQNNKYLLINSENPINEINFDLSDLNSRAKNCLIAKIDKPDDELIKVLLSKSFSDRQIIINNKLIDFIAKRIARSYGKIFEFIYKIDEISLKKKKSIDQKIIKEVLGK